MARKKKSLLEKASDAIDHAIHPDHVESDESEMDGDEVEASASQEQVSSVLDEVSDAADVKPAKASIPKDKKPSTKKVRGKDMKFN